MTVLILIAFSGLLTGFFLILKMSPFELAEGLTKPFTNRRKPIAKMIHDVNHTKEPKGIKKTINDAKEVLILTGKQAKFTALCTFSFFLFVIGILTCILINNFLMIPVAAVGFAMLPFWYVIFTSHSYKKMMNAEMETALSIITTSYLRNESIITAVQENIDYLNPPVSDVFKSFLAEANMISCNTKQALTTMKAKLNHSIFHEWIDAVIACQEDKTLKSTLTPIIAKLSDIRIVSAELDYLMYEPLKEFITMAILVVGNIPLIYFLNKSWYHVLVATALGKGILTICAFTLFISLAAVIRLTKPVDYRR